MFLQAFGPVSQMTESAVMQMGCITQGFSHKDLERLPFSLDAMEDIAHCGWDESQVKCRKQYHMLMTIVLILLTIFPNHKDPNSQ